MAELSSAGVRLDRLTQADVAAAAALSASIGWNQDEADWRRLLDLHPEGAVAARRAGELVGTATLVSYEPVSARVARGEPLAWLGMVIVSPSVRGQGIGSAVMDAALAGPVAAAAGVIGLDATEFGAPLYRRRGFETVTLIDRWAGTLGQRPLVGGAGTVSAGGGVVIAGEAGGATNETDFLVRRATPADLAAITALDNAETGVDRSALLRHLAAEESSSLVLVERGAELLGYAALRTGRVSRQVGPLVACDAGAVERLLNSVAELAAGSPVYLDSVRGVMPPGGFEAHGLSVVRTLERMTRPAAQVMQGDCVVAAMGFAWG